MNPAGDPAKGFALLVTGALLMVLLWGIVKVTLWLRDEREKRIAKRVAEELRGGRRGIW